MSLPDVVSRDEWVAARKRLLAREKEYTRAGDALSAERRMLPMVEIDKEYIFEGPGGQPTLIDLFEGRRQLMIQHFMFDPAWEAGCPSCSSTADEVSNGLLDHLHDHDTTFAVVARAPFAKVDQYRASRGWTFPWYSSYGSDFNYDFHVTLDPAVAPLEYNYRAEESTGAVDFPERPGLSCFLRVGDRVFHTYSAYGRGTEPQVHSYRLLDLTALGRQEDWEEPKGRAPVAHAADPGFTT
jgi:predicted dithiol-disulfide oxidoreductase (DUF899 family)